MKIIPRMVKYTAIKKKRLPKQALFLVTRRRFELRTHCLKGSCSADWASGSYIIINKNGWDGRIRTDECQSQSLMPYRLATSQYRCDSLWPDTLDTIARKNAFGNPFFQFFWIGFRALRIILKNSPLWGTHHQASGSRLVRGKKRKLYAIYSIIHPFWKLRRREIAFNTFFIFCFLCTCSFNYGEKSF